MDKKSPKNKKEIDELENAYSKMTKKAKSGKFAKITSKKTGLIIGSIALAVVLVLGIGGFLLYNYIDSNRQIEADITVAGVSVQGMTRSEAAEAVMKVFDQRYKNQQMEITVGSDTIFLTPDTTQLSLDTKALMNAAIKYNNPNAINEEFSMYGYIRMDRDAVMAVLEPIAAKYESTLTQSTYEVTGSAPESVLEKDDKADQKLVVTMGTPGILVDTDELYDAVLAAFAESNFAFTFEFPIEQPDKLDLQAIFDEYCTPAVDAVLDPETFEISNESLGYGFDVKAVETALEAAAAKEVVTIPFQWLEPAATKQTLTAELFKDKLSELKATAGWNADRNTNLAVSCKAVNGYIVMPGETFSFNKVVGPRTIAAGYRPGNAYIGGEVVLDVGGGICQVSSALYCCAVLADLQIVERYNHAYLPSYVPYSQDATVAWGGLDFKFKNNTEYPIKIEASASGGTVVVRFWGTDTKDYYVKFASETIRWIPYETIYQEFAPDNEEGYTDGQVISKSSPCSGAETKSYRVKYDKETNQRISTTLENHDTYGTRKKIVVKIVDPNPQPTPSPTPESTPTPTPEPSEEVLPPSGGNGGIEEDG